MKIRIKGNSIRIRLTRSEVAELYRSGAVWEVTEFPSGRFEYGVELSTEKAGLEAEFCDNRIRFMLPYSCGMGWPENEVVGFNGVMTLSEGRQLLLLLEKDFTCLERRDEDESDQYPNPKALH